MGEAELQGLALGSLFANSDSEWDELADKLSDSIFHSIDADALASFIGKNHELLDSSDFDFPLLVDGWDSPSIQLANLKLIANGICVAFNHFDGSIDDENASEALDDIRALSEVIDLEADTQESDELRDHIETCLEHLRVCIMLLHETQAK